MTQQVQTDAIPDALKERKQWVTWRYHTRKGDDKPTKVPFNARTGDFASSKNADDWSDYHTALRAYQHSSTRFGQAYDGIGFVFSDDDNFVGVDLDDCLTNGTIAPWAKTIIEQLPSYAEISPSGTGVKIFVEGSIPNSVKLDDYYSGGIEMYNSGRYFTVTGQRFGAAPSAVQFVNGALTRLHDEVSQEKERRRRKRYLDRALDDELKLLKSKKEGGRNNQLYDSTRALMRFVQSGDISENDARDWLLDAATGCGLSAHEARQCIDSAFRGTVNPFQMPAPQEPTTTRKTRQQEEPAQPTLDAKSYWSKGVTAKALRAMHFDPLHWVVDDILPEGCTLLAGKPKARKSWLALNIGLAVALGGRAMSFKNANKGDVLYLDLESNERRAQRRLESTLRDMEWPDNFHLFTEWPKLDAGGDVLLEQWMLDHPDTKLIVIDVFQDIRAVANPKAQLYSDDRAAVEPLRRFASTYHVAVLIIHHTRKAKGDDVFDEISGSTGLTGGVDTIMVLSRDAEDGDKASLAIRGRDIEFDNALQLEWDFDFCQWRYKGEDSAAGVPADRKALLKLMEPDVIYTPAELAELCGKTPKNVSKMLRLLESGRHVASAGFGKYKLVDNNSDVNEGRSGGSGRTSRSGGSSGSGMNSPLLPLLPQGYREVEVYTAVESQETATSTTSTTSTHSTEAVEVQNATQELSRSKLDWASVQRWYTEGKLNNIRMHCVDARIPFDTVMDELRGISLPDDFETETL